MKSRAQETALPILGLIECRGRSYHFSAKPRRSPWNWLSLASLVGLAASAFLVVQAPSDGAMLACAVAGLGVISFGSIYLVMRRSHRTMILDFEADSASITEALGAERETRWNGGLSDLGSFEFHEESWLVVLHWLEPDLPPNIVVFPSAEERDRFLEEASSRGIESHQLNVNFTEG